MDEKVKELLAKFDDAKIINEIEDQNNGVNVYIGKDSEISEDV